MARKRKNIKDSNNNWSIRLVAVLKEKNISIRKAASIAGVSSSVIDSWTSGASPNDLIAVKNLCDELETSFTWLLTGEYEKGKNHPPLAEIFEEIPYFEGLARIRIDRLMPKNNKI